MRRRDHDRIVAEKDRTIAWLEQWNRDLRDELLLHASGKPRPPREDYDQPVKIDPALQLVEPGEEWDA